MGGAISQEMGALLGEPSPFFQFMRTSAWATRAGEPGICDFVTGNPQEPPLPEVVDVLQRSATAGPFTYKTNEPYACTAVAENLQARYGVGYRPQEVCMVNGSIAGLIVTLRALVDPGDEVAFFSPPWFGYEPMILGRGATPVRIRLARPDFDLNLEALAAAASPRLKAVIVNSPNNPTGRIYPQEVLAALASLLEEISERNGRPVYLISDEAYSHIVFDGRVFPSPAAAYRRSVLSYTYAKTLLMPGQRLGYLAVHPAMPDAPEVGSALFMAQVVTGWAFPNAVLQYGVAELETLSIDLRRLEARRDRMVAELRRIGYETNVPEGTFYVLVRSPVPDDLAFTETLAGRDVFVLPGSTCELPGYIRISLTATDEMVEQSIPGFEAALKEAG